MGRITWTMAAFVGGCVLALAFGIWLGAKLVSARAEALCIAGSR